MKKIIICASIFIGVLTISNSFGFDSGRKNSVSVSPESAFPFGVPSGVARGDGELIATTDTFRGRKIFILVGGRESEVAKSYLPLREFLLREKYIGIEGEFTIFDSIGEVHKRPDGHVYVKSSLLQSNDLNWLVLCVRWKPSWAKSRGCWLFGNFHESFYEVDLDEDEIPSSEALNAFVISHL